MLDTDRLVTDLLAAAQQILGDSFDAVRPYATAEFRKLAETLVLIAELRATGAVDDEQARLLLDIQKNASRTVLLTLEGIALLTAERVLNAALGAVTDTINRTLGFELL
ncbi:MAG: hypothetical protein U5L04_13430 [Trueperaceae bacterium]|nr:hypothetical protein [Trueperaceae bacterium]